MSWPPGPRPGSLTERLALAVCAAFFLGATPWWLAALGRMVRRSNGPGDPAALLWWPVDSWHAELPLRIGILAGLVVGGLIFVRRNAVKPALVSLAAILFASVLGTALSWSSMLKVYPDRVELTEGRFPGSPRRTTVGLNEATAVEAYCHIEQRSRNASVAKLAYVIRLPVLGEMDLGAAALNPQRPSESRLGILKSLDNGVLHSVPGIGDGEQDGGCLRLLHAQFGTDKFAVARSLMRIDDQTYLRLYAEPHESWNGRADR